jgi:hypothetical protein
MVNAVIRHLFLSIFHDSWYVRDESGGLLWFCHKCDHTLKIIRIFCKKAHPSPCFFTFVRQCVALQCMLRKHGPNNFKDTNRKRSSFIKNCPVKGFGGRWLSACSPLPSVIHCINTFPCIYSHREGGRGQPVKRLEGR